MTDERLWKRRFLILALVRLSGTALVVFGLLIAFSDSIVAGGNRLSGLFVTLAGLIDLILFPAIIRQRWKQP